MRQRYVVSAGVNKIGRPLYLSNYKDAPEEWAISVVPTPSTKTECWELMALAKRQLKEQAAKAVIKKSMKNIEFNIIEWNDTNYYTNK